MSWFSSEIPYQTNAYISHVSQDGVFDEEHCSFLCVKIRQGSWWEPRLCFRALQQHWYKELAWGREWIVKPSVVNRNVLPVMSLREGHDTFSLSVLLMLLKLSLPWEGHSNYHGFCAHMFVCSNWIILW